MPGFNNINVNTVYQTVLSILNKEQRGYITPYEFNNLANQVQLEIFESYFEDLNVFLRSPENSSEYSDRVKSLREKISVFETTSQLTIGVGGTGVLTGLTPSLHRLGFITYKDGSKTPVELQEVTPHEFTLAQRSTIAQSSSSYPVYYQTGSTINVFPQTATSATAPIQRYDIFYVRVPNVVNWAYTVNSVGAYIYDPGVASVDFEISDVDQTEVILKILAYAGVVIRDSEITQMASQAAAVQDQKEKM